MYMNKNLDRGFKDLSIFEIGPIFNGPNPGEQNTVVCGLSAGKKSRLSWIEKDRIFIQYDEVIKKMILKLGGKVKKVLRPFKPEGGAYGIGRTHSHKH